MLFQPIIFPDGEAGFEVYDYLTDTTKVVDLDGAVLAAPQPYQSLGFVPDTPLPEVTFYA